MILIKNRKISKINYNNSNLFIYIHIYLLLYIDTSQQFKHTLISNKNSVNFNTNTRSTHWLTT